MLSQRKEEQAVDGPLDLLIVIVARRRAQTAMRRMSLCECEVFMSQTKGMKKHQETSG